MSPVGPIALRKRILIGIAAVTLLSSGAFAGDALKDTGSGQITAVESRTETIRSLSTTKSRVTLPERPSTFSELGSEDSTITVTVTKP